jgi:DNA-binding CsgD family transcriptional regulator
MIGSMTPRSRPQRSERHEPPSRGQVPGSLARIVIGTRAFIVVPESLAKRHDWNGGVASDEQARFALCGKTFMVVEEPADGHGDHHDVPTRLTERELQIAILVALGNPSKRIAYKLGITEWTVKEYLRRIFAKLRVRSQAAMVYQCADLLRRLDREGSLFKVLCPFASASVGLAFL